jgi:hypothetical protein
MSSFQYYEFHAVDRPLNKQEQAHISSLSSRVQLTPRQAIFTYAYSDFRGDPLELLARSFDMLFYQANWGTTQLAFRFPSSTIDPQQIEPYCIGMSIELLPKGEYTLLNISIQDEDMMGWIEPDGKGGGLLPLRDAIIQGDMRLLYIVWLKAAQHDEALDLDDGSYPLLDEDADLENPHEPPVPTGLQTLTASLQHGMAVFGIDADLVAAAAEASTSTTEQADHFAQWVPLLPEAERNAFLVRIAQDDSAARPELIRRLREVGDVATGSSASATPRRTLQELLDRASDHARQRKAREKQDAAQARQRELDALAPRENALWEEVIALIEQKNAAGYDRATKLLVDLRDLARRQRQQATFEARMEKIVTTYANRSALLRRLRKVGLA